MTVPAYKLKVQVYTCKMRQESLVNALMWEYIVNNLRYTMTGNEILDTCTCEL